MTRLGFMSLIIKGDRRSSDPLKKTASNVVWRNCGIFNTSNRVNLFGILLASSKKWLCTGKLQLLTLFFWFFFVNSIKISFTLFLFFWVQWPHLKIQSITDESSPCPIYFTLCYIQMNITIQKKRAVTPSTLLWLHDMPVWCHMWQTIHVF